MQMPILATPKETPYIIKKSEASKIINSKNSSSDIATIERRARAFELNNLKRSNVMENKQRERTPFDFKNTCVGVEYISNEYLTEVSARIEKRIQQNEMERAASKDVAGNFTVR